MKNNAKFLLGCILASGILSVSTGCNTIKSDPTSVTIAFAECGFGRQYIEELEKGYNAMYPDDPIHLVLDGDS